MLDTEAITTTPAARRNGSVTAVEVVDLRKEFIRRKRRGRFRRERKQVAALDGVSFTMLKGETLAILGQNGSGKSTLVRLLSTLLLPDGGSARILGHDVVAEHRAVRRLVNRVSVEASFFKKMSATENLSYAARFYGMPIRETRRRIPEILERVGFPKARMNEPLEDLSRGMQQKVALARALLTAPIVLLLDEPTTGLDPRSKLEVQDFIREIRTSHDSTILLCTHDLAEAEALADRVGLLDRGIAPAHRVLEEQITGEAEPVDDERHVIVGVAGSRDRLRPVDLLRAADAEAPRELPGAHGEGRAAPGAAPRADRGGARAAGPAPAPAARHGR
jgi:ABC-2 type transport system ATP-binding protein